MDRNQKQFAPKESLQGDRSLESLEDLIQESLVTEGLRERFALPHPLSHFAEDDFQDGVCADFILECIHSTVFEEPESPTFRGATWFLLESKQTFYFVCSEAGIDAEKLRNHLRLCELPGAEEMDELHEGHATKGMDLIQHIFKLEVRPFFNNNLA